MTAPDSNPYVTDITQIRLTPDRFRWQELRRGLTRRTLLLAGAGATALAATPGSAGQRDPVADRRRRVCSWATAPTAVAAGRATTVTDVTLRQIVHLSTGGDQPCVMVTNEFGTRPIRIGGARIGRRTGSVTSTDMLAGTGRDLTFDGSPTVTVPAGGTVQSDPAGLDLPPAADLIVDLYLPDRTELGTISPKAYQTNLICPGDVTGAAEVSGAPVSQFLLLAAVTVRTDRNAAAVVAFGDSITAGARTRNNVNHRWPDLLAARLRHAGLDRAVLNTGISGNRLLTGSDGPTGQAPDEAHVGPSGLDRLDRDALTLPGARYLITLLGVNDLGHVPSASADDLITAHRQVIARARIAGLAVLGGTLLPFGGARALYDNRANRARRETFNAWIRYGGECDGVIDFAAAVLDPDEHGRLRPDYDSGDHLHPNEAGMGALADAVPLDLFA
ncbi:SGNH/GDSL hydrolase family protein [Actinoplanes sp. NBRC 101535]|uniref:SGNH/GDSL hydrolase family protein n=1 Tax=Actinoplanes sp. NBRC 101535 TaxID=3032196 RepID=UPI0024A5C4C9|nr:SGNH/GDSL hydrolase family protein [Actinoplanes sp. NBRC 101535]GLY00583.1 hypothetical protein Acsp01_09620 [Actinoplanes sp. NBRC 101535]